MNIWVGMAVGFAGGVLMAVRLRRTKMMILLRDLIGPDPSPPPDPWGETSN